MKCLFCGEKSITTKYLVCPGTIMVPNAYSLCGKHKDKVLKYEDVYEENGKRKPNPEEILKKL
jgi:hypothetical protein